MCYTCVIVGNSNFLSSTAKKISQIPYTAKVNQAWVQDFKNIVEL